MNRVRLLTEFDAGGDIANFYRLSCLYEMHRLTEYPSGSGRTPCLITVLCKCKSFAEGQEKREEERVIYARRTLKPSHPTSLPPLPQKKVVMGCYNAKGGNQRYKINVHLEDKMQCLLFPYGNVITTSKSVESMGIYLCNSFDWLPSPLLCATGLASARRNSGEASVASCT